MHCVVAMRHVPSPRIAIARGELYQSSDGLVLTEIVGVLGAPLPRKRLTIRRRVPADDLSIDQVVVHGVEPSARLIHEIPDLDVVRLRIAEYSQEAAPLHV